jgi:hypothetical protein
MGANPEPGCDSHGQARCFRTFSDVTQHPESMTEQQATTIKARVKRLGIMVGTRIKVRG